MKCVLIGYGYWGKILKKYIESSKFFELFGIYDPSFEKSIDMDSILKDKSIECAFICNPIDMHYLSVKKLLENGKHVFCEKPLSKSLIETEELFNLAKSKKLCLFIDYIYTNSPSINVIKEEINSLGKILYCEGNIQQFGKFYKDDDVFEVLGVHMISAISYILDSEINIIKVISKKENSKGIIQTGSLEFESNEGIKGIINSSLLDANKERKIIFRCENGNISFNMLGSTTVSIVKHIETERGYEEKIILDEKYDETNNLINVLQEFKKNIENKIYNDQISLEVAKALEKIKELNKERE